MSDGGNASEDFETIEIGLGSQRKKLPSMHPLHAQTKAVEHASPRSRQRLGKADIFFQAF